MKDISHTQTPEVRAKRKQTLIVKRNDPDYVETDARRAEMEKLRRAQRKRNLARILGVKR